VENSGSVATAHGKTLWQTLAFKLEAKGRFDHAEAPNLPDNKRFGSHDGAFLLLVVLARHCEGQASTAWEFVPFVW
jgi:hypothetical protein